MLFMTNGRINRARNRQRNFILNFKNIIYNPIPTVGSDLFVLLGVNEACPDAQFFANFSNAAFQ